MKVKTLKYNINGMSGIKIKHKGEVRHQTPSHRMQKLMVWDQHEHNGDLFVATNGYIIHAPDDMSLESDGGLILTGKTDELGEKPVPVSLCSPQIPHGLIRART
jgi:hypothetical protein